MNFWEPLELKSRALEFMMSGKRGASSEGAEEGSYTVDLEEPEHLNPPPIYRVLLHNDDYTPMEFVVSVLKKYFAMDAVRAEQIMLDVHHSGVGVCGLYTKEIAETKTFQVMEKAKQHQYPLKCTYEEDTEDS